MSLYERDYARLGEQTRESSALAAFIKKTYQLFAASLLAGAAGAYVGVLYTVPIFASLGMASPFIILGVAFLCDEGEPTQNPAEFGAALWLYLCAGAWAYAAFV